MMAHGQHHDRLVLADLAPFGGLEEVRAQVRDEIRRAGGAVRPPQRQESADPSGSVRVVVDARGWVTGVAIRPTWQQRVGPGALAQALFQAYRSAMQQALTAAAVAGFAGKAQRDSGAEPKATPSATPPLSARSQPGE